MLGKKVLWVSAASQQTLFIVSGSQFIKYLREVTQMLCLGAVVLRVNAVVRLFSGGRTYLTLRLYLR